jgi:type I restriction enzyme, R subunit
MSASRGTETEFELTTIERLERLGYAHRHGEEIARPHDEVVLRDLLRANLAARYPEVPDKSLDEAVARISRPPGVDTLRRNKAFHQMLVKGFELKVELPGGRSEHRHIHPVDWDDPERNEFLIVNQLSVHGQNDRRPDIILFVNGLPLVLFELKNPFADQPTVDDAYNQVQHYRYEIPQVFDLNALVVVSDGITTLHGMWPADMEWFAPWKSIDGFEVEPNTTGSMKTLVEGLFPKDRLLSYIRDFIVFEVANDKITKKGAKYHQFFAVRLAAQKAVETVKRKNDRRIGVIWHTTGSGKSLSMVFLVGILRREKTGLENPTFVIQVDRVNLDEQLEDQFVAARDLVGPVQHAESTDDLRRLLETESGEVILTTLEKFRLKTDPEGRPIEAEHPVLSTRSNVIVIADEAHSSQYGFVKGHARWLRHALPNASFVGFTGTPISFSGADTVAVFGELIHTYDIKQSQEDHATVPIYYSARQIKLNLKRSDIDVALQEITEDQDLNDLDRRKARWAALAEAAGAKDRVALLARDLLDHFLERTATMRGKALVVCMTRQNCVRVYEALTAVSGCPETRIVMTANFGDDPPEWAQKGYYTTSAQRKALKERMEDIDDPLRIVIVCDMWLTGTDIPCLHTLYVDKPMKGHNMIQAISRVNRVFRDKDHGMIVDYIGIGDELREATNRYTAGGGTGDPAPDVDETARPMFQTCLAEVRQLLPAGKNYGGWRKMSGIQTEDLYQAAYGRLAEDDERRQDFLQAELRLTASFLLVKHFDDCRSFADEIIFYQRVRNQVLKAMPGTKVKLRNLESAVRDLVDDSVETAGVVDIFKAAGLPRADISILDDNFLQTFKDHPQVNLRLKLLEKLVRDEIQLRRKKNLAKAKSFQELLEATLRNYHNRIIDAAAVVKALLAIHKDMESEDQRAKELNLEPEEVAFYDAVAVHHGNLYEPSFLRDLIHEVVQTIKKNLKVDWTEPHREDVKAAVRAAVRRILRKRGVKEEHFEVLLQRIMEQAEAIYAGWPVAA